MVNAALAGEDVTELGHDPVRGVDTTHYRITVDDAARTALGELAAGYRSWFGLDELEGMSAVDVGWRTA